MTSLLKRASDTSKQAMIDYEFKRFDRAYVERLISSEILVDIIPQHQEYPFLDRRPGNSLQKYRELCNVRESPMSLPPQGTSFSWALLARDGVC